MKTKKLSSGIPNPLIQTLKVAKENSFPIPINDREIPFGLIYYKDLTCEPVDIGMDNKFQELKK